MSKLTVSEVEAALEGTPYAADVVRADDLVVEFRVRSLGGTPRTRQMRQVIARRAQAHLAVAGIYSVVRFRGETGWTVKAKGWA